MLRFYSVLMFFLFVVSGYANEEKDTIHVGYTQAPPFIIPVEDELEGISIWLWEIIANDLDLEFQYVKMEFPEMINALEKGEIDLSINPLTITEERVKNFDFTLPFYAANSTVAVKQAGPLHRFMHLLTSVLSFNFLSGLGILAIIIIVFGFLAWLFERYENPEQFRKNVKGIWDGIWWSVVTMTTVGYGDKAPKSRGGKFIALIWMFSGLIFISGFTASIASSLTVTRLHSNTNSVNDFKDKRVGCVDNTTSAKFLKRNFFHNIVPASSLTKGLVQLQEEQIDGFFYDEPILKWRLKTDKNLQNLEVLPLKFNTQFYAFAFSHQHKKLSEQVSQKIMHYAESQDWRMILAEYDLSEF